MCSFNSQLSLTLTMSTRGVDVTKSIVFGTTFSLLTDRRNDEVYSPHRQNTIYSVYSDRQTNSQIDTRKQKK